MNESRFESMVPSELCLKCDVCCRFPEPDSPLAPYFTSKEVEQALSAGVSPKQFQESKSGRIRLVAFPPDVISPGHQEGCVCPAFNPSTQECGIYPIRPLDCRLYPFALMKNESGDRIVLGIDTKCPFIQDPSNKRTIEMYGNILLRELQSPKYRETIQQNPELIGSFQDDVTILESI
jgi:Fe-S-cluster containining protein